MTDQLNQWQRICADTYADGEFAFITSVEDTKSLGDTLFRFLIIELATSEGCETKADAQARMYTATAQVQKVGDAVRCHGKRRIAMICETCGDEHGLYWDTSTYWDEDRQVFDSDGDPSSESFCGKCGGEGCCTVVDLVTREELAEGPDWRKGWLLKADADAEWDAYHAEKNAARAAAESAQRTARHVAATADLLTQAYEVQP